MTTAPWIQEPTYDQDPLTGNAAMAWMLANSAKTYIDTHG